MRTLRLVDSITELGAHDQGCIAVSGSHGGVSSAKYAHAARPLLSVFNDAGSGKDNAGLVALAFLQACDLAACTVSHHSAHIGSASSTLAHGLINHTNTCAADLGILVGWTCRQAVDCLMRPTLS